MIISIILFALSINQIDQANHELFNQDSINLNSIFDNHDFFFPLIFMGLSFAAICVFYYIHMKRIMKEITNVAPAFDLVDNEAKIDFTIAERH